jgi:hypothetical protein
MMCRATPQAAPHSNKPRAHHLPTKAKPLYLCDVKSAQTSSRLTLFVSSKTLGELGLHTTFERQRDRVHAAGDTHSPGAGATSHRLKRTQVT